MKNFVEPSQTALDNAFDMLSAKLAACWVPATATTKGFWAWTHKTMLPELLPVLFPGMSAGRVAQVAHKARLDLLAAFPNKMPNWTSNQWTGEQCDKMLAVIVAACAFVYRVETDEPAPIATKGAEAIAETPQAKADREKRQAAIKATRKVKGGSLTTKN